MTSSWDSPPRKGSTSFISGANWDKPPVKGKNGGLVGLGSWGDPEANEIQIRNPGTPESTAQNENQTTAPQTSNWGHQQQLPWKGGQPPNRPIRVISRAASSDQLGHSVSLKGVWQQREPHNEAMDPSWDNTQTTWHDNQPHQAQQSPSSSALLSGVRKSKSQMLTGWQKPQLRQNSWGAEEENSLGSWKPATNNVDWRSSDSSYVGMRGLVTRKTSVGALSIASRSTSESSTPPSSWNAIPSFVHPHVMDVNNQNGLGYDQSPVSLTGWGSTVIGQGKQRWQNVSSNNWIDGQISGGMVGVSGNNWEN
ncbi:hypothetical protein HK096_000807, partial [Nowakowskiella sp. JEL0078]